jgi:hypothetical protein
MSDQRIIFVPQYPTPMRYQEWWSWKFPLEFRNAGFDVVVLGEDYVDMIQHRRGQLSMFSPVHAAIEFETVQIDEYMNLKLLPNDILFLADLSFPGFFANVLYHKRPSKSYAFCHATSLNDHDYFGKVRYSKFPVERSHALMFDKIFVGSYYHLGKLDYGEWTKDTEVTCLPLPPLSVIKPYEIEKSIPLISTARPCIQKTDPYIEDKVEEQYGEKIFRKDYKTWSEYCKYLSISKVLLVTAKEETFGYQVVDAIINNCIPVVPDAFSYPEMVSDKYRYQNLTELFNILDSIKSDELGVPDLLCKPRIINFYDNIIKIIRKEGKDYPF